jgi:hypothetical protein
MFFGLRRRQTLKVTLSSTKKFPYYKSLRTLLVIFTLSLQTPSPPPACSIFFAVLALSQFTYYK